ncbi:MATH/TRAF domain [Arabidopsis thaliana x Arabidopsis arenosa]|uniref:MATH/TRAF domain n=1 Tax=Arabidopsis thaliana x Arabidopsis arenosa TaxID=1240361 RepID=A0A8T1XI34_9BRAS|nr:MATH/TRAF domain [Arabidopsis thaliana x Arabidopsis arenosa]
MYVEIDSTSEVFAYVKFFVYNKKEQNYFTIQADSETLSEDEKIYVHADLQVLYPRPHEYYNHVTGAVNVCYKKSTPGWGCEEFVTIAKLREGYCLDNDTLKLEVEFKIVSATKYSHP